MFMDIDMGADMDSDIGMGIDMMDTDMHISTKANTGMNTNTK
jgi:hypothetical protein